MKSKRQYYKQKYGTRRDIAHGILIRPIQYEPTFMDYVPIPGFLPENNWESIVYMLTIGGEARGEPDLGLQAVAEVIVNRFRQQKSYFGKTIRDCCIKQSNGIYQFECWNPKNPAYKWIQNPNATDIQRIVNLCEPILHGITKVFHDRTVCYYRRKDISFGSWADKLWKVETIGNHTFFSDPSLKR